MDTMLEAVKIPEFKRLKENDPAESRSEELIAEHMERNFEKLDPHKDCVRLFQLWKPYYETHKSPIKKGVSDARLRKSAINYVNFVVRHVVTHPFRVFQRQCQLHNHSVRYNVFPCVTRLIRIVFRLYQTQGVSSFWKGCSAVLLARALQLYVEDLLFTRTNWPKEISLHSSLKEFYSHVILKCVSLGLLAPFYPAILIQTVQTHTGNERLSISYILMEPLGRLVMRKVPTKVRLLPVWVLIVPTVAFGLAKSWFTPMMQKAVTVLMQLKCSPAQNFYYTKELREEAVLEVMEDIELLAPLITDFVADVVFYPYETILHRLCVQCTATLIDNIDDGQFVVSTFTDYEGFMDGCAKCVAEEGAGGLYKGIGLLVLRYVVHFFIIWTTHHRLRASKPRAKLIDCLGNWKCFLS
ncbi:solute carrier family 25 member 46-B-like isoform X2 [Cylas formicarius]|uniref:solute carrier family 25 member 46-B-like isoform X2 n=1 Tax=Cylas formicarius TaxID=197179 RepID=UPI00295865C0|nr:solute carrier family 25 member 46-B-like isoform X2 [Cylas formicarius]